MGKGPPHLKGRRGRPEKELVTGWEECARESWAQGVRVRGVRVPACSGAKEGGQSGNS